MAEDIYVTEIDVVREYNATLNKFRIAVVACGAIMDGQIRDVKSKLEGKKSQTRSAQQGAASAKDQLVRRYEPIRREPLPGCEVAGNSDYDVQLKYQELEAAVNDFNKTIDLINDKMTEIGQRTKTFCTIFDSEVVGYNRKLQDTITIMDSMKNMKM